MFSTRLWGSGRRRPGGSNTSRMWKTTQTGGADRMCPRSPFIPSWSWENALSMVLSKNMSQIYNLFEKKSEILHSLSTRISELIAVWKRVENRRKFLRQVQSFEQKVLTSFCQVLFCSMFKKRCCLTFWHASQANWWKIGSFTSWMKVFLSGRSNRDTGTETVRRRMSGLPKKSALCHITLSDILIVLLFAPRYMRPGSALNHLIASRGSEKHG